LSAEVSNKVVPMKFPIACLAVALGMLLPPAAWSQVSVSINIAPPPLLLYAQPPVPGEGYIWMPGYWRWSDSDRDYYWVPGTWVMAPNEGDLWTPGYWAFERGGYFWHMGYWGRRVGFYGGINYGYGYFGSGYQGGRWDRGSFRYNRAISNVGTRVVHQVYSTPAASNRRSNRISFNGGKAGAVARPTASQRQFQSAEHAGPRAEQVEHETAARGLPTQHATGSHVVPQVAATPRPSEFASPRVEHVRTAPTMRPQHMERQAAPQARPEAPQATRVERSRPDQRGPAGHPEPSQHEDQPRKERRER
jgi:hypothetical protein